MEFFEEIQNPGVDAEALKEHLQISALPGYCESISTVISDSKSIGEIYTVWGQFSVSRQEIRNGIRFALIDCPHAFAWTITHHDNRNRLLVHCTINDREEDEEFIESIRDFVSEWGAGLSNGLPKNI